VRLRKYDNFATTTLLRQRKYDNFAFGHNKPNETRILTYIFYGRGFKPLTLHIYYALSLPTELSLREPQILTYDITKQSENLPMNRPIFFHFEF